MKKIRFILLGLCVPVALALSACSSNNSDLSLDNLDGNPYATEIKELYETTTVSLVKSVLEDGVISEAELAEVRSRMKTCLADVGYSDVLFYSNGTYTITTPEGEGEPEEGVTYIDDNTQLNDRQQCELESGYFDLIDLYLAMVQNPHNQDFDELMIQCLKDKGVVEPNFSQVDLERVSSDPDNNEHLLSLPQFQNCASDPLGLMPEVKEVDVS